MHYIKRSMLGITVGMHYETVEIQTGLRAYLEQLHNNALTTMDGRCYALKKRFGLKYHVPLYIDNHVAFYTTHPLRDMDTVCINYYQVLTIKKHSDNQAVVVFRDLSRLIVGISCDRLRQKHEKTGKIIRRIEEIVSA